MFDDSQEVDSLLGIVEVPLLPLAHGKDISGVFEISNRTLGGGAVGVMAVKMEWSMSYLPPSSVPDILTPDPTDRSDRVYSCDVDIGKLSSFVFILSLYSLSLFFVFILCFFSSILPLLQRFERSYRHTVFLLSQFQKHNNCCRNTTSRFLESRTKKEEKKKSGEWKS